MTTLALVMAVGVIGTAYAYHGSFFGTDCDEFVENVDHRTCSDLNNLNERVHQLAVRVVALELIHNTPDPLPTELTLELEPNSIIAGEDFTAVGEVPYVAGLTLTLGVFDPPRSTYVHLATVTPNQDGSYFVVINTGGPTWAVSGVYPVIVNYNGESIEALLEYTIP